MSKSKFFETGQVVATKAIHDEMQKSGYFATEVYLALKRYYVKDWGCSCEESKGMNDSAVVNGDERIMAVYDTCKGKIWIITEWDRSATTVLFPSDY